MKIYIDSDYKCHVSPGEGLREIEVPDFDGCCAEFIEGYRYIPNGEVWLNPEGVECSGVSPWKDYNELHRAQLEYELSLALAEKADMSAALEMLGVSDYEQVA